MPQRIFFGKVRAHLLSVGIIRPAPHVTAIDVNAFLSAEAGAPVGCGKITDVDKSDVPRFLNRRAPLLCPPEPLLRPLALP